MYLLQQDFTATRFLLHFSEDSEKSMHLRESYLAYGYPSNTIIEYPTLCNEMDGLAHSGKWDHWIVRQFTIIKNTLLS